MPPAGARSSGPDLGTQKPTAMDASGIDEGQGLKRKCSESKHPERSTPTEPRMKSIKREEDENTRIKGFVRDASSNPDASSDDSHPDKHRSGRSSDDDELEDDDANDEASDSEDGESEYHESDDNDSELDEDSEQGEDGYKESAEKFPEFAAYDPKAKELHEELSKVALSVSTFLSKRSAKSAKAETLAAKAENLKNQPAARRQTIGLLGTAGVGKSSLVNSVTDIPRLAKALDSGQSCTHVVMLYSKALPTQHLNFSATIEYFDSTTIGQMLKAALRDWKIHRFEADPEWPEEVRIQCFRAAMTCKDIYRAALCEWFPAFTSDASAFEALDSFAKNLDPDIEPFVKTVERHFRRMRKRGFAQQPDGTYKKYKEAKSPGALRNMLDPLVSDTKSYTKTSMWAFVRQVTVGVRGSRMLDACTIADLPGVSDTNQVRVRATHAQIKECDYLWIVSNIGRIVTDPAVDSHLESYASIFQERVSVIATRSDESATYDLAIDMDRRGFSIGNYRKLHQESKVLDKALALLGRQMKKTTTAVARDKMFDLQQEMGKKDDELNEIKIEQLRLVVRARNAYVTQELQADKSHYMANGKTLKVFCVSNAHYLACKGEEKVGTVVLDVADTGIPALRKSTLGIAAPGEMNALEFRVLGDFRVFVAGLDLWAQRGRIHDRDSLLSLISLPEKKVEQQLLDYFSSVDSASTKHVVGVAKSREIEVIQAAVKIVDKDLKRAHFSPLKAFVRQYGNHNTPTMGKRAFNDEFTRLHTTILMEAWEEFAQTQDTSLSFVEGDITKGLSDMVKTLNGDPATIALNMSGFGDSMTAQMRSVKDLFYHNRESHSKKLRAILIDATKDQEDSYFYEIIKPVYDECMADKGKGTKERILQRFRSELSLTGSRSPFTMLSSKIHAQILRATESQVRQIHEGLKTVWGSIDENFDLMASVKEEEEDEATAREDFKPFFLEEIKPKYEAIVRSLEELKGQYEIKTEET